MSTLSIIVGAVFKANFAPSNKLEVMEELNRETIIPILCFEQPTLSRLGLALYSVISINHFFSYLTCVQVFSFSFQDSLYFLE